MVNASHLPRYLHPLFFGMQMWHLPSLPFIHSLVLTYLQHICDIFIRRKKYFVQIHFLIQWNLLGHMYLFTCFNVCMPDIKYKVLLVGCAEQ